MITAAAIAVTVGLVLAALWLVTATANRSAPLNQVVQPFTRNYRVIPTITAGSYSAGQVVGGLQTIPQAVGQSWAGNLASMCVKCVSAITPALEIYFLDTLPTAGTYTDTQQLVWSTDWPTVIHQQAVATGDFTTITSANQRAADYGNINKRLVLTSGTLYMVLVATGTFTPTGTADLTIDLNIQQEG